MKLAGANALVTGAASGIGRASARLMAARGAKVALVDIDAAGLDSLAAEIAAAGGTAITLPADISAADAFDRLAADAEAAFGQIDLLMNNVGVLATGKPEDIPPEEWGRILNLNLLSAVRATHRLLPGMVARGRGHIVNTASFAGLFPYAWDRLPYVASKAALVAVSEGLALYLIPQGIGVTCFCPGPVRTGIGKTIRSWTPGIAPKGPGDQFAMLEPEEAAQTLLDAVEADRFFVVSDDQALIEMRKRGADPEAYLRSRLP
ncbi:SDR family NAD(P)-dependent oxidoreductase [Sphingomonas immobilis]|uniref:SDR family oxidoreductase n=1 Tax=Sphingomonas immobilis TaxID=3063997 RepID=A0ABT8ZXB1_9SPHN|nr:SDR family oxidoreductase [Sphingomonas sp. CA1-15]MDO7842206.1 SDR family oxidoreductase [Sphingomonas sp. CA1-15]